VLPEAGVEEDDEVPFPDDDEAGVVAGAADPVVAGADSFFSPAGALAGSAVGGFILSE